MIKPSTTVVMKTKTVEMHPGKCEGSNKNILDHTFFSSGFAYDMYTTPVNHNMFYCTSKDNCVSFNKHKSIPKSVSLS